MARVFNTHVQGVNGVELRNIQLELLAADPTGVGLRPGRIWHNTTDNLSKYYDGTAIQPFPAGAFTVNVDNTGTQVTLAGNGLAGTPLTANITDGSIVSADFAPNAVDAAALADNAVDTAAIVDGNVTLPKLDTTIGLDDLDGARLAGDVDLNNNKVVNVADPTANLDATNKQYVDGLVGSVAGQYVGAAATFAALPATDPDGSALEAGDHSILTADDGANQSGHYSWNGAAWQFVKEIPEMAVTATETVEGISELATDAEAIAGTDTTRNITPANLAAVLADRGGSVLFGDGTVGPFVIPHGITALPATSDLMVSVTVETDGLPVEIDVTNDATNITVTPVVAVAANAYRATWWYAA